MDAIALPTHALLSDAQRRGLAATVVTGFLSAVPAFILLIILLYFVFRQRQTIYPITVFYLSLLFWDVVQALGWIVSIRWVHLGQVETGSFCLAQATIQQVGAIGVAGSIVAMSYTILHDYVIDSERLAPWVGPFGILLISCAQALDIGIPNIIFHGARNYYGIAGYWCWISNAHFTTKIVTEYLFYWFAGTFSFLTAVAYFICMYIYDGRPLPAGFLWIGFPLQGNKLVRLGLASSDNSNRSRPKWGLSFDVVIPRRTIRIMLPVPVQYFDQYEMVAREDPERMQDGGDMGNIIAENGDLNQSPLTLSPVSTASRVTNSTNMDTDEDRRMRRTFAFRLLFFPLAYLVLIAPISIVRFIEFSTPHIGWKVVITVAAFFSLTGFADVVLFIFAAPAFGIAGLTRGTQTA